VTPTLIALGLAVLAGAGFWATALATRDERPVPERAILERRVEALEQLVRTGQRGNLVPFDQALVVIGRPVLQDLLDAAMPYETEVDGRFRIRILSARVTCDEGIALVRLDGRASFKDQPENETFVEATMYGALREFDLERDEHVLRGRVDVLAFDVHQVRLGSRRNEALKGLIQDLAELKIEAFRGFDYAFDVPVKLVHEMVLPGMIARPGVRIAEVRIPLHASVTGVTALEDRLWISMDLRERNPADSAATMPVASSSSGAR